MKEPLSLSLPLEGRWRRSFMGSLIIVVGFVTYFGVISDAPLPDHRLIVGINDVVLHVGAFGILSLICFLLWSSMGRIVGVLVIAAAAIEVFHLFSLTRHGEFSDFAASCAGIAAGAVLFLALRFVIARLTADQQVERR
jgi:hypothetical protein